LGHFRDVEDHAAALVRVIERGIPGATYNLGADEERKNIDIVRMICRILDEKAPDPAGPRERLIRFVSDRPGHDRRYALDWAKIRDELGWTPTIDFDTGLPAAVRWYASNRAWWEPLRARAPVHEGSAWAQ
jgi:dTDP-glucose 4,6-dehydratase